MKAKADPPLRSNQEQPQTLIPDTAAFKQAAEESAKPPVPGVSKPAPVSPQSPKLLTAMYYWVNSRL